jgi:hypothetical protein
MDVNLLPASVQRPKRRALVGGSSSPQQSGWSYSVTQYRDARDSGHLEQATIARS